jgi:hypothetical protein
MRNISENVVDKIKTHMLRSVTFSRKFVICEKLSKNMVVPDWPQASKWRMRDACWMPNATHRLSDYVILVLFNWNNVFPNEFHCCFVPTLPVLLIVQYCSSLYIPFSTLLMLLLESLIIKQIGVYNNKHSTS